MIAAFQRRPLIVTLAVLAAALAGVIALEMALGARRSAVTPPAGKRAAAADAKLLPPVVAIAPEQAYPETTSRPLFLPTRRPAPEAVAVVKSSYVPGQFVLQGVTVAGDTRIAMLREKSTGRMHRVERGKEVNGIKVVEVQRDTVTLGQGGDSEVLSLSVQRPPGAPPGATTAVPAAAGGPFAAAAPPPAPLTQTAPVPAAAPAPGAPPPAGSAMTRQPGMFPSPATPSGPLPSAANPPQPSASQPTAAPMSPEELLARRRARRNQQNQ